MYEFLVKDHHVHIKIVYSLIAANGRQSNASIQAS